MIKLIAGLALSALLIHSVLADHTDNNYASSPIHEVCAKDLTNPNGQSWALIILGQNGLGKYAWQIKPGVPFRVDIFEDSMKLSGTLIPKDRLWNPEDDIMLELEFSGLINGTKECACWIGPLANYLEVAACNKEYSESKYMCAFCNDRYIDKEAQISENICEYADFNLDLPADENTFDPFFMYKTVKGKISGPGKKLFRSRIVQEWGSNVNYKEWDHCELSVDHLPSPQEYCDNYYLPEEGTGRGVTAKNLDCGMSAWMNCKEDEEFLPYDGHRHVMDLNLEWTVCPPTPSPTPYPTIEKVYHYASHDHHGNSHYHYHYDPKTDTSYGHSHVHMYTNETEHEGNYSDHSNISYEQHPDHFSPEGYSEKHYPHPHSPHIPSKDPSQHYFPKKEPSDYEHHPSDYYPPNPDEHRFPTYYNQGADKYMPHYSPIKPTQHPTHIPKQNAYAEKQYQNLYPQDHNQHLPKGGYASDHHEDKKYQGHNEDYKEQDFTPNYNTGSHEYIPVGQDYFKDKYANYETEKPTPVGEFHDKYGSYEQRTPEPYKYIPVKPVYRTRYPTPSPTPAPTYTRYPTRYPTPSPTWYPTRFPTLYPTKYPTKYPTPNPTKYPTNYPTKYPTNYPTKVSHQLPN